MHILVIGAGLAGLTCARTLVRAGQTVTVIEAAGAVGGRVRSDRVDGFILDHGFQVLFTAYPAAQRQLDYAALQLRNFDPGAIICLNGTRAVLTDPLRDFADALPAALSPLISPVDKLRTLALALELRAQTIDEVLAGPDTSTEAYLLAKGFGPATLDRFFRPFYGGIFLDRSLATSAKCFKFDFKLLSEGATVVPAAGMGVLSDQLAAELFAAGAIRLHTRAEALLEQDGRVAGVILADGTTITADAVVVATPAPEAARLSKLPMPSDQLGTVTLYFAGSVPLYRGRKLLLNAHPDAFVNNAVLLSNVAPSYAPPGQHLLSATVLGVPTLDDTELVARAMADLRLMFVGDPAAQRALDTYQPLRLYRIPYAQFAQPPGLHPGLPDNQTARPGLFFAGEFTEASSLNAAMISGEKCAALIIES
ncbi:MAG: protoporphyrinogen/coproporphyrinogen oxidase [Oscillochloridaceae bacterium umkhey_bin13]